MITRDETLALLKQIKVVCPRFSLPSDPVDLDALVRLWCGALNIDWDYPTIVYEEALSSYFATASRDDNAPMPGDIRAHCKRAVDRIIADPVRGQKFQAWRESRDREREDRITMGQRTP